MCVYVAYVFLYVAYVCLYVAYACECTNVLPMRAHAEARVRCQVSSSIALHFFPLETGLSLKLSSLLFVCLVVVVGFGHKSLSDTIVSIPTPYPQHWGNSLLWPCPNFYVNAGYPNSGVLLSTEPSQSPPFCCEQIQGCSYLLSHPYHPSFCCES